MQVTEQAVRKEIVVGAPQQRAFDVFAAEMTSWWPFEGKSIGADAAAEAVVEPRAGGRWFERAGSGEETEWGRVLAYEPPGRLVLDWQISAQWSYDAELHTEVEVRFIAEGEGRTRVVLEHRGLDVYGDDAAPMLAIFSSADGWSGVLDAYAAQI